MALSFRMLKPTDWKHIESLFGPRGACGDCWCMHWRLKRGESVSTRRSRNKGDFKALVEGGRVHAALAFEGDTCVGWCNFGPKTDFDRLCRSPKLGTTDNQDVWSIPCFFTKVGFRKRGIGSQLLAFVVDRLARKASIRTLEAYPSPSGKKQSSAFIFTGLTHMFESLGFRAHPKTRDTQGMRIYRLSTPRSS